MNYKTLFILIIVQIVFFGCANESNTPQPEKEQVNRVVAYLPYYRMAKLNPEQLDLVTDVIVFSVFPDPLTGKIKVYEDNSTGNTIFENQLGKAGLKEADIDKVVSLCKAKKVKTHLCVGGGDYALPFSQLVDNGKSVIFAKQLKAFCLDKGLNGVDIDWEFPKSGDVDKVGILFKALYDELNPSGISLSGAFASSIKWQKPSIESAVNNAHMLDMINVMGYRHDMTNLLEVKSVYVDTYGVDRSKLIAGIPFYTFGDGEAKGKPYFWLMNKINVEGVTVTPSMNQITIDGITYKYNGVDRIKEKVKYGMNNLGGVMIWELGHDVAPSEELSLLKAVNDGVKMLRK
jgi:hypothetical protein